MPSGFWLIGMPGGILGSYFERFVHRVAKACSGPVETTRIHATSGQSLGHEPAFEFPIDEGERQPYYTSREVCAGYVKSEGDNLSFFINCRMLK